MRAAAALAYAVTCYLLFLASFLAFAAFVGGLLPPPFALDVEPWQGAAIDIGLVVAFGLQHSIMARQGLKRVWTRIVPPVAERATYVLAASIMLGHPSTAFPHPRGTSALRARRPGVDLGRRSQVQGLTARMCPNP